MPTATNLPKDSQELAARWEQLCAWFPADRFIVVTFSGGVDSTLVLKAAVSAAGTDRVLAVTADSPSLARAELEESKRLASEIGAQQILPRTGEMEQSEYRANDGNRCFFCKTELYRAVAEVLRSNEFQDELNRRGLKADEIIVADGLNADDLSDIRPGRIAAERAGVVHPLVEVGVGKSAVRELAKFAGLPNWNKPAMACLSSRIPRGTEVTSGRLSLVERAEEFLHEKGFHGVRVRLHVLPGAGEPKLARIELPLEDMQRFLSSASTDFTSGLLEIGFQFVTLDLGGYKKGGLIA